MNADRLIRTLLILATLSLLAFILAVEFWPANAVAPDQVVRAYLEAVTAGDELAALGYWQTGQPAQEEASRPAINPLQALDLAAPAEAVDPLADLNTAVDVTIHLADTLGSYDVGPATYWSHCCEPTQLDDGADAFAARVQVTARLHQGECGADELAQADPADFETANLTIYLSDAAHDSVSYDWGLPWERWFARPRGRQVWRIVAVSNYQ